MGNYKTLRSKLDAALLELETADSGDIDKLIALHKKSLELIAQLEKELAQATQQAKKQS